MKRIVIVGDLHLRARRLADGARAWARAVEWAYGNNADLIAQGGDVFDHYNVYGREASTGTVYDAFLSPFVRESKPIPLVVVIGNHDKGGPFDKDAFAPLDQYSWLKVIREPSIVEPVKGLAICGLPWLTRAQQAAIIKRYPLRSLLDRESEAPLAGLLEKLHADVRALKKKDRFVLFVGHLEVIGAALNGGLSQANGSFEFSPLSLASIGCDAYALAHIHVRQSLPFMPRPNDGYLGAVHQLHFGEQGNAAGWRVLDIDDGRLVDDRWIDDPDSPRYVTLASLDETPFREGFDYVKLRGEERPEDLPEGVVFEKRPAPREARMRSAGTLDSDTPFEKLLSVWLDAHPSPLPAAELVNAAELLRREAPLPTDAMGALDRIDRIVLKNIAVHMDSDIDLSGVTGICGIEGPTGSGKTTLLEAIGMGLYGGTPTRPTPQSCVATSFAGDARIEVDFVASGKKLRIRRVLKKTKKTFKHEAFLYEDERADPIAGPGVDDVFQKAVERVGDPDLLWAGAFCTQDETGNLLDLEPAERKHLFSRVLGTDALVQISERARKAAMNGQIHAAAGRERIGRIQVELEQEESFKVRAAQARSMIAMHEADVEDASEEIDRLQPLLAAAGAAEQERLRALEAKKALDAKLGEQQRQIDELSISLNEDIDSVEAELKRAMGDARSARALAGEKRKTQATAAQQAAAHRTSAHELEAEARKIASDRQTSYLKTLQAKKDDNAAKSSARGAHARTLMGQRHDLEVKYRLAQNETELADRKTKLLTGFPDVDACRQCPLAADGLLGREQAAHWIAERDRLHRLLVEKTEAIAAWDQETSTLLAAEAAALPALENWRVEDLARIGELEARARDLRATAATVERAANDGSLAALEKKAAGLEKLENEWQDLQAAKLRRETTALRIAALREAKLRLAEELAALKIGAPVDETVLREALAVEQQTVDAARLQIGVEMKELGKVEALQENCERLRGELAATTATVTANQHAIAIQEELAGAFGRDGIPQLVVDRALPRFEELMADLLVEFDGRWSIRVLSQSATLKGKMREVIEILIDDGNGERELFTYSGGEKKLLRQVVRLAFSMLQAERSGKGIKVLLLDEATDMMDADLAQTFVRMLTKIAASFTQIFIVSHNDAVLSSLPARVTLTKTPEGVKVTPPILMAGG